MEGRTDVWLPTLRQRRRDLADEVFSLIHCEFCDDAIDADVLLQDVDHISRGVLPGSEEELLPPREAAFV